MVYICGEHHPHRIHHWKHCVRPPFRHVDIFKFEPVYSASRYRSKDAQACQNFGAVSFHKISPGTALEAVVESALVTWLGLLLYEISSLAPTGGITVRDSFIIYNVF